MSAFGGKADFDAMSALKEINGHCVSVSGPKASALTIWAANGSADEYFGLGIKMRTKIWRRMVPIAAREFARHQVPRS